jgi:hypothetical protein
MKNILEDEQSFKSHALIDYHYYALKKISEIIEEKKDPIKALIDKATGYDMEEIEEWKGLALSCLDEIIKNKKIIEADFSIEEKIKDEIKAI